jgi:N-glycosylase/DNA lyase
MTEKAEITKDGIIVESEYFDASATILSGQCFRFYRTDSGYGLISGDKKCILTADNNITYIKTDYPDYFYNYFDLGTGYNGIVKLLRGDPTLSADVEVGKGIHMLRQQLFETIISFIISANNNIPRIKGIIERICSLYGEKKDGFYAFPTPTRLKDVTKADYFALGAGYRADYLPVTVKTLLDSDLLQTLPCMDYAESVKALMSLKGVGRKVADCICLFALFHTECYPVDTWIQKVDGLSPNEARKRAAERYGVLAGYAQQYRYYAARLREGKL